MRFTIEQRFSAPLDGSRRRCVDPAYLERLSTLPKLGPADAPRPPSRTATSSTSGSGTPSSATSTRPCDGSSTPPASPGSRSRPSTAAPTHDLAHRPRPLPATCCGPAARSASPTATAGGGTRRVAEARHQGHASRWSVARSSRPSSRASGSTPRLERTQVLERVARARPLDGSAPAARERKHDPVGCGGRMAVSGCARGFVDVAGEADDDLLSVTADTHLFDNLDAARTRGRRRPVRPAGPRGPHHEAAPRRPRPLRRGRSRHALGSGLEKLRIHLST